MMRNRKNRRGASLRLIAITAAMIAAPLAVASPGGATTESTAAGNLIATFTYAGTYPQSRDPRLTISRAGTIVYDQPVSSTLCANQCQPELLGAGASALHIVHLQAQGPRDVVLDLFSGGAHCCSIEQVFHWNSVTGQFQMAEYNFGDPGARLIKLGPGGSFAFLSADDAFAYAFTDFAASGLPIMILRFSGDTFRDVTRSFPSLIAHDAHQWRTAFDSAAGSHYQDTTGIVAAWAADQDMLGHFALVRSFLASEAKAGHLNSVLQPGEPNGQQYVVALERFLRAHHYVK